MVVSEPWGLLPGRGGPAILGISYLGQGMSWAAKLYVRFSFKETLTYTISANDAFICLWDMACAPPPYQGKTSHVHHPIYKILWYIKCNCWCYSGFHKRWKFTFGFWCQDFTKSGIEGFYGIGIPRKNALPETGIAFVPHFLSHTNNID